MKNIYTFLLCLLIYSCAKTNYSKKVIQNESSQTIKVTIYEKLYNNRIGDTLLINPSSEAIIESFESSRIGPAYLSINGCANPPLDSIGLEVNNKPSLKVKKDITNSGNWTFSKSSNHREVNVECRFRITNADIAFK